MAVDPAPPRLIDRAVDVMVTATRTARDWLTAARDRARLAYCHRVGHEYDVHDPPFHLRCTRCGLDYDAGARGLPPVRDRGWNTDDGHTPMNGHEERDRGT